MKKKRHKIRKRKIELLIKYFLFFICIGVIIMFIKKNSDQTNHMSAASKCNSFIDEYKDILSKNGTSKMKPSEFLIPFTGLSQATLPTGCEAVSTTAVLQYYNIKISTEMFIDKYLPCDTFYWKNNKRYGPDPHIFFAGSPYASDSLGCYPEVILKALRKMKTKGHPGIEELTFETTIGTELEDLVQDYLLNEIPVLIWVTINMLEPYDGYQYYLEDGTLYTWAAQEHCAVLCGYDEENYYLMDPMKNGEIIPYSKEIVEKRYEEIGKNSLVIYR